MEVCRLIHFIIQEADEEVTVCEMTGMVGQLSVVYPGSQVVVL